MLGETDNSICRVNGKNTRLTTTLRVLVFCLSLVPFLVAPQGAIAVTATDNFARGNGSLGPDWTDMTDGGLAISSDQVVGTNASGISGDIRTAETYGSDQYSQIEITSTPVGANQWIGPAVRIQNGGQNLYTGIYYGNSGSPVLMLFKLVNYTWTQLGSTYASGVLAAGTQLRLSVTGTALTFSENGVARITAVDTSLSSGAPGIIAYGTPAAGDWAGGDNSSSGIYTVGGNVSGLSGTVVLENNGGDSLNVSANGSFTFATQLASGAGYNVTLATNPAGQSCSVLSGAGTIASANITNVSVSCTSLSSGTYSVGGNVSGLSGTVVLENNGGDSLNVSANGSFTFATQLASGAGYNVTVATNPAGQSCSVLSGAGTIASANITNVSVSCTTNPAGTATDNFARGNGSLGPDWTDMTDGGLAISSDQVVGTNASGISGDIRTAETYGSDQYSQIEITSTPVGANQWIGPAVRIQNGGQNLYTGIYYGNSGSPVLMLFKLVNYTWTQLGSTYASGVLAAGTQLRLSVTGTALTFSENGVARITAVDTSLSSGAPGIIAYGTPAAGDWAGGDNSSSGIYTVGGNVSGLSGTVVLENNGGDSLNVSANGSFTFATQLASGAGYNVTLATNPAGQSCSVLSGAGTIASANITNVSVSCTTNLAGTATDNFARGNGSLGPDWTDMTDGGLAISSDQVVGTNASGISGDVRTAETYTSDQYSQIEIASTPLGNDQWIGPAVRAQNGGQDLYTGVYYVNNGAGSLILFKRSGSTWTQLGSAYNCPQPLPAGTVLKLMMVGNTLSFLENGVERVASGDSSYTGGAPGIIASGTPAAVNWSGGSAGFEVHYLSTDSSGINYYDIISANNGYGPQVLRVLQPTHPVAGVAHNFLYALPVEPGLGTTYGDAMSTLAGLDAQDQYNVTLIEPSFNIDPWYANNPNDPQLQYETFMTMELQPWVVANLKTSGTEQNWLIGFSKSGYGGQDLILKHPTLFTLAASWDFPADMTYDTFGADPAANYGTDANFESNYHLTQPFVDTYMTPFLTDNRIWIGGYYLYMQDITDYDALLTSLGIAHTLNQTQATAHSWDGGWVPSALVALYQDSMSQQ